MSAFVSKKVLEAMKHNAAVALHAGDRKTYHSLQIEIDNAEEIREAHIKSRLTGDSVLVSEIAKMLRQSYGIKTSAQHVNQALIELGLQTSTRTKGVYSYHMTDDAMDMAMAVAERTGPTTSRLRWDTSVVDVVAEIMIDLVDAEEVAE